MAKKKTNTSLKAVEEMLNKIESDAKRARLIIGKIIDAGGGDIEVEIDSIADLESAASKLSSGTEDNGNTTVVEWVYDGYFMVGSDKKKYPVPMNYSSKTKLIPGDVLKLRIMSDGKLIYKLIGQANRTYVRATLSKSDENKFTAIAVRSCGGFDSASLIKKKIESKKLIACLWNQSKAIDWIDASNICTAKKWRC